jgi:hypothetical protein
MILKNERELQTRMFVNLLQIIFSPLSRSPLLTIGKGKNIYAGELQISFRAVLV